MEASRSGMQDALGRSGAGGAGLVLRRRAGEQLSRPRWAAEAREGLPLGAGSPPPACLNFLGRVVVLSPVRDGFARNPTGKKWCRFFFLYSSALFR